MKRSSDSIDGSRQIDTLTGTWLIVIAATVLTAAGIYRYQRISTTLNQKARAVRQKARADRVNSVPVNEAPLTER